MEGWCGGLVWGAGVYGGGGGVTHLQTGSSDSCLNRAPCAQRQNLRGPQRATPRPSITRAESSAPFGCASVVLAPTRRSWSIWPVTGLSSHRHQLASLDSRIGCLTIDNITEMRARMPPRRERCPARPSGSSMNRSTRPKDRSGRGPTPRSGKPAAALLRTNLRARQLLRAFAARPRCHARRRVRLVPSGWTALPLRWRPPRDRGHFPMV